MKLPRKLLVSFAALVVGLPLLELGLRLVDFRHREFDMPPILWNPRTDKQLRDSEFLFRKEVGQLWAPNPGATVPWGEDETINEDGYRGPQRAIERTPGLLRIVTLGDSSTFGHSVSYDECYSAQLEVQLANRGIPCEVLCGGVVGHGILQGTQRYKRVFEKYHADVVILAYGAINEHIPAPGAASEAERIRASFEPISFTESLARRIRPLGIGHLAAWIADGFVEHDAARDAVLLQRVRKQRNEGYGNPDWPGVRSVSPARFRRALTEIAGLVATDGALPIFVSMPRTSKKEREHGVLREYTKVLEQYCAEAEVSLVDVRSNFLAQEGPDAQTDLLVDPVHPSVQGHELIARLLADKIEQLVTVGEVKFRE